MKNCLEMESSKTKQEMFEKKKVKKKLSKAQMQLAIIKKKQCDAKALKIVEQLLEPNIEFQWLLQNLQFINKSHMEDVTEERAIVKLCGYVLCKNPLTNVINQQYHISTRKNKVYDVTRRKNFCCSRCYGACNYLLEQMLTSPLWLRDKEEVPEFKILPAKDELERSVPGDEVFVRDSDIFNDDNKDGNVNSKEAQKDLDKSSSNMHSDIHLSIKNDTLENSKIDEATKIAINIETPDISKEQFPKESNEDIRQSIYSCDTNLENIEERMKNCEQSIENTIDEIAALEKNLSECLVSQDTRELNNDISLSEDTDKEPKNNKDKESEIVENESDAIVIKDANINNKNSVHKQKKPKSKKRKEKTDIQEIKTNEFYNLAMHIEQNVKEWITEDTVNLLSGEESIKNQLLENVTQHDRYLHLCKKLNKLQLEDEKDERTDLTKNTLKPLPHLSVLREEGKKMELKVRAFYKGDMVVETLKNETVNTEENSNFTPVLPLTDAHAPKALRRRIFLDKLNRILPDLLWALTGSKMPQHVYSSERSALIKALINTFSLSATNITFKTVEWTLVGLIIIRMMGMIDPQLKIILFTKQASMYISMILMSYKLDSNYLDRLVMELTNNTKIHDVDDAINF